MMQNWIHILGEAFREFGMLDVGLLIANSLLILFSRHIVLKLFPDAAEDEWFTRRVHFFRAANLLVVGFVLFYRFFLPLADHSWITRLLAVIVAVYLFYLGFHIVNYLIKKRFGREHELNGERRLSDTYNSRILGLIVAIIFSVIGLIAVIRIMGFDSLLEAGGVIGVIGVMLALTQGAWAPDIISGLIILNSRLVDEGDVIELHDGEKIMSVVFKTKIFHTELLNLVNNHRVMIQNARLRGMTIANLSRFASARGLRENLRFKVGYDVSEAQIEELFKNVFERANKEQEIPMEYQYPLQVAVMNTGDFAVEWGVYYYLKEVKKLLPVRQQLLALTLQESSKLNISLATPLRYVAENEVTDKP